MFFRNPLLIISKLLVTPTKYGVDLADHQTVYAIEQ